MSKHESEFIAEKKITITPARCAVITPALGMGCTVLHYSDRTAHTVIYVSKSGKTAWIRRDKALRTDGNGMSDSQTYTYTPDPEGEQSQIRLSKHGDWRQVGTKYPVLLGARREYFDFSF